MTNNNTHVIVEGSERAPAPGAKAIGPAKSDNMVEVTLELRAKKELPQLTGRPKTMMTREQITNLYGTSQSDIDKVVETFEKYGLKSIHESPLTHTVKFKGTVSQMQDAFQVQLFHYKSDIGDYRGREGHCPLPPI